MFAKDSSLVVLKSNRLSKPPMPTSRKLAVQAIKYMRSNPQGLFAQFNAPQLAAIEAALSRRVTMIQGPPGTQFRPSSLNFLHLTATKTLQAPERRPLQLR